MDSMNDPDADLEINCRAQLSLLEACRYGNPGVKVVFASIDTQPVWQYLNLCNLKRIKLQYDQMSGVPTATYDD